MDILKTRLRKIKNIFFKEQTRILSAAGSLMILTLFTKFSGMLFTALLARQFGASRPTDIFNAANAIPELITAVVLIGAISGSVIPVLIRVKSHEEEELFLRFFNTLLNLSLIAFILLSFVIVIFSHDLVRFAIYHKIIDPVTPFTQAELNQIGSMMKLLMVPQAILGVSAFVSSALNIYHRFIIPSLAPLFYNLGRIIGVTVIVTFLDGSIYGVVWGILIGALLHIIIQLPVMFHVGIKYKPVLDLKISYIQDVVKLALPRVIALAGEQISVMINDILALSLVIGSSSAYNFAMALITIPMSLFGATFAVAAFPTMSKYYDKGDFESYSILFRKVINQIFFLAVPAAVIIWVLRLPLTRLFFGILGGNFNWHDTRQVAWVVFFFALGLPFETLRSFLYRTFYSMHDSIKPLIGSILTMCVGIFSAIFLSRYFSHFNGFEVSGLFNTEGVSISKLFSERGDGENAVGGLALAMSIAFIVEFFLLMTFLYHKKVLNNFATILFDLLKKLAAGLMMMGLTYYMFKFWENILSTTKTLNLMILTGTTSIAVLTFYIWVSYILRVEEVDTMLDYLQIYWYKMEKKYKILKKIRELI